MKPKIGFIGTNRQSILEDLNFAIINGFDCYEIQGFGERLNFKLEIIREIKKISNNDISLNLHVMQFLPIANLIPEVSKGALKFAKKEIILAKKVDANRITIHGGERDMPNNEIGVAKNFEILIKNLKEIVKFGRKYGIKIGLENSFGPLKLCRTSEDLLKVVNLVEGLGITFDIGHANIMDIDPVEYFKKVKDFVINIHLHDNNGEADQHALIGKGNINFKTFLKECKNSNYHGPFIFEIFPREDVFKGREMFLNIWKQI